MIDLSPWTLKESQRFAASPTPWTGVVRAEHHERDSSRHRQPEHVAGRAQD